MNRTREELIWAMDEWLKCPLLDAFERSLVEDLKTCAQIGTGVFRMRVDELLNHFAPHLRVARDKALRTGFPRKWPEHAPQS